MTQQQDSSEIVNSEIEESSQVNSSQNQDSDSHDRETRYKDGQMLDFIKVRFPGHAKAYQYLAGKRKYVYGQRVVAMSDRGMAVGYINSFPYQLPFKKEMLPLKHIKKIANEDEHTMQKEHDSKEKEAEELCVSLVEKHNLDMDITHVEFTQFGKKAVFYFVAPERVDFRGLVKDLVSNLKMRIELRQISIRDRAASLGGIGPCGRQLCCSTFLSQYGRVNIKMAKNQNLTLIPSRLNGLCGQLKCCTSYENEVYTHKRNALPTEYDFIKVKNGDCGKVLKVHILIEQFDMMTDLGKIRRYSGSQYDKQLELPEQWEFPERFDHVVNETSTVIGLEKREENLSREFLQDLNDDGRYDEYFVNDEDDAEEDDDDDDDDESIGEDSDIIEIDLDDEDLGQVRYQENKPSHSEKNVEDRNKKGRDNKWHKRQKKHQNQSNHGRKRRKK